MIFKHPIHAEVTLNPTFTLPKYIVFVGDECCTIVCKDKLDVHKVFDLYGNYDLMVVPIKEFIIYNKQDLDNYEE